MKIHTYSYQAFGWMMIDNISLAIRSHIVDHRSDCGDYNIRGQKGIDTGQRH